MESAGIAKTSADSSIPSCESCRKRKLKCTREQPTCINCDKFAVTCIYHYEKKKPGFKIGAVESLSRRLDHVEKTLSTVQKSDTTLSVFGPAASADFGVLDDKPNQYMAPVVSALSSLTKELQSLGSVIASSQLHVKQHTVEPCDGDAPCQKKQRLDVDGIEARERINIRVSTSPLVEANQDSPDYQVQLLWNEIVDAYFFFVHPWISILHEPSVRAGLQAAPKTYPFPQIFQAMEVAALRFVRKGPTGSTSHFPVEQTLKSRQEILVSAMDDISVQSVQTLLILIYIDLGDGSPQRAFGLLGVVARHISHLQLSVECPVRSRHAGVFGESHPPLAPLDWIEEEERRRLFWNFIMLDRLCAIILGCDTSFSSAKILRRLPACASFWSTNQPRLTPFLRFFDPSDSSFRDSAYIMSSSGAEDAPNVETNKELSTCGIGALAFYVETVEAMGTIEFQFLRQPVDSSNSNDVSRWLTRFQRLDAYLMQWKRRLPQHWRDSGVSRRVLPGVMDPAMTAANATHNTCLILLHERIAYPESALHWVRLPSLDSAEICVRAATEVCTIIGKFLEQRPAPYALTPQLGLCAYVSARSLLVHWQYYRTPLAQPFWLLLQNLDTMNDRWTAQKMSDQIQSTSLFSQFARRLRKMHADYNLDICVQIDKTEPLYQHIPATINLSARSWLSPSILATDHDQEHPRVSQDPTAIQSRKAVDAQDPDLETQANMMWGTIGVIPPTERSEEDSDLLAISQTLLSSEFTSMDRIVSFEEMMLGHTSEAWDFS